MGFATHIRGKDGQGNNSTMVGTISYMAPEVLEQRGQYRAVNADLFAIGVILFNLLAGYPPFDSASLNDRYYGTLVNGNSSIFW